MSLVACCLWRSQVSIIVLHWVTHACVGKLTSCPMRGPACRRNDATTSAKTLMVNLHPRLAMIDEIMDGSSNRS